MPHPLAGEDGLLVERVLPGGAVEAWGVDRTVESTGHSWGTHVALMGHSWGALFDDSDSAGLEPTVPWCS